MSRKLGILCMVLGVVLLAGALAFVLHNRQEDARADQAAAEVLPLVKEAVGAAEPSGDGMPVEEIDDYGYVGFLSIPALGLELPVMETWDNARLKIAPCRYSGSTSTNNLVICAHNYTRHFGQLSALMAGDIVSFTDMNGHAWQYEVVETAELSPDAVVEMTTGDFDLALFTCTYGGAARVTVRCQRAVDRID